MQSMLSFMAHYSVAFYLAQAWIPQPSMLLLHTLYIWHFLHCENPKCPDSSLLYWWWNAKKKMSWKIKLGFQILFCFWPLTSVWFVLNSIYKFSGLGIYSTVCMLLVCYVILSSATHVTQTHHLEPYTIELSRRNVKCLPMMNCLFSTDCSHRFSALLFWSHWRSTQIP